MTLGPEEVRSLAERAAGAVSEVVPLAGDASTRRFYRVRLASGDTLVAMLLDGPFDEAAHPQILVGSFLDSIGFPVPRLAASFPDAGVLLYEDLGDTLLEDLARARFARGAPERRDDLDSPRPPLGPPAAHRGGGGHPADGAGTGAADQGGGIERFYEDAVDLIGLLQGPGTQRLPAGHPSAAVALDRERFLFELGFFREHYIERLRAIALDRAESSDLAALFDQLATDAASPPRVLCHRDYHARNLMVWRERLRVVDFQDARLGPLAYDLASLLRDSYVVLPADLAARLLDRFVEKAASVPLASPGRGRSSFQERFDVVALQRNLKAIGTFAYQTAVLGRPRYRDSIEPTWTYIFGALGRLPAYSGAGRLLARIAGR